jgi:hypothetical protein
MDKITEQFVFSKKNLTISNQLTLEVNDVGIVESELDEEVTIFFIRIWSKVLLRKSEIEYFDVRKTGDAFTKKICNVCHKLHDTREFSRNQNGINNRPIRRPSCITCRKILEGMNMHSKSRVEWLKSKPVNVPFECPICLKRTIAGVTSKVVLDHNHITGEPRAWICDSCNTGIGRFKDDIALLQRAIKFLG